MLHDQSLQETQIDMTDRCRGDLQGSQNFNDARACQHELHRVIEKNLQRARCSVTRLPGFQKPLAAGKSVMTFGIAEAVVEYLLMRFLLRSIVFALAVTGSVFAQKPKDVPEQDPTIALPKAYKVEFDNERVRVVRAHYDANATLPEHAHPGGVTVYLYLNASSGVLFSHDDGVPITRPAVQPGAIRIGSGPAEHHTVKNLADAPTDFLRVLLKDTAHAAVGRPNSRMPPGVMDYDNAWVHVSRIDVAPGSKTRIEAKTNPVLRIAWIPGKTEWRIAAKDAYRYLDKGTTEEFTVTGDVPMQLVTIELRQSAKSK